MTNEQGYHSRPPRGRGGRFEPPGGLGRPVESRNGEGGFVPPPAAQGAPVQHANSPPIHNTPSNAQNTRHERESVTESNPE